MWMGFTKIIGSAYTSAPPAQPRPHRGMRLSRSEKGSLFITRASMLGVEIPVLLTK